MLSAVGRAPSKDITVFRKGCATEEGTSMNPITKALHQLGQSIWLDNITREILINGTLARYIKELSVTGLTSNPTIFEHAIGHGNFYDEAIAELAPLGEPGEDVFFALALQDSTQAADLFRSIFEASDGVDGWVSLEVSPLLANDAIGTIKAAARLHAAAARPNLFIKIPGTVAGVEAIEESIFAGIPINVTLLFSCEHYVAAAEAYLRGIERRITAGLDPKVESVASLFISRWDAAVKETVSPEYRNRLGIAIAMRTYKAYRDLLVSERWQKLARAGAHPQRLLWASTGTKDSAAQDTLYIESLAEPGTVNTMPENTLLALADHGKVSIALPVDDDYAEMLLAEFARDGIDIDALAERLQREGAEAFSKSWEALLSRLKEKSAQVIADRPVKS